MYKLIALDIDGTLLKSDGTISDKTIEALDKAKAKGVMVTLSTGRPVQGVLHLIEKLELDAPVITYNGAVIAEAVSKEITFSRNLKKEDAKQAIDLGLKEDVTLIVWSCNKLYVNRLDEKAKDYEKIAKTDAILIEDYDALIDAGITKVLWYDTVEGTNAFMTKLEGKVNESMNYCTSRPYFLEFFDGGVSKAEAMAIIGESHNIKQSEMIAFGDGLNDLSMIEYAGLGVAMGNAEDAVKAKADYVTASNDEDGIAKVIDEFIFA